MEKRSNTQHNRLWTIEILNLVISVSVLSFNANPKAISKGDIQCESDCLPSRQRCGITNYVRAVRAVAKLLQKVDENQPSVHLMLHGIKKHLCHILSYELLTMICA